MSNLKDSMTREERAAIAKEAEKTKYIARIDAKNESRVLVSENLPHLRQEADELAHYLGKKYECRAFWAIWSEEEETKTLETAIVYAVVL